MVAKTAIPVRKAREAAWRALEHLGITDPQPVGGIPFVRDGKLYWVYNAAALAPGVENCADPVKVEALRRAAHLVGGNIPTYEYLAQIGYSSGRTIMERPIKNRQDVIGWADSIFNWGPSVSYKIPEFFSAVRAKDAIYLSQEDFHPLVNDSGDEFVVVPVSPLNSGDKRVEILYSPVYITWKSRILGPRSTASKSAFSTNQPKKEIEVPAATATKIGARTRKVAKPTTAAPAKAKAAPKAQAPVKAETPVKSTPKAKAPAKAAVRRVGRPRLDGLAVGSKEVEMLKAAYAAKRPVAESVISKMTNPARQAVERARNEMLAAGKSAPKPAAKAKAARKAPAVKASSNGNGSAETTGKRVFAK